MSLMPELVWWVSPNYEVIQRPRSFGIYSSYNDDSHPELHEVCIGRTVILESECNICFSTQRHGLVSKWIFDTQEEAVEAAEKRKQDDLSKKLAKIEKLQSEYDEIQAKPVTVTDYDALIDSGVDKERTRLQELFK